MRRSKLEIYEAILEVLAKRPSKVDKISYKSSIECTILKRHLDFMMEKGLVEERCLGDRRLYALTERGKAVFRALSSQKRLEEIVNSLKAISKVLEAAPIESNKENEEKRTENGV